MTVQGAELKKKISKISQDQKAITLFSENPDP